MEKIFKLMDKTSKKLVVLLNPKVFKKQWIYSCNIGYTNYHVNENCLEVGYKVNCNVYLYKDVPLTIWRDLNKAKDIGTFMAENVKGKYRYERIK